MDGNISYFYLDAVLNCDMSPEERGEDLNRLKEESDKLSD